MNGKIKVVNPHDVELELSVVMTLSNWKRLRNQFDDSSFPAWKMKSMISDLVRKAENEFEYTDEVEK